MSVTYGEQRTEMERRYDDEVLARVRRGMALLQEKFGDEWVDRIDMKGLDLTDGERCVLGQVYYDEQGEEGYSRGIRDLYGPGDDNNGASDGFTTYEDSNEEWDELQAAWEDELTPRVKALR